MPLKYLRKEEKGVFMGILNLKSPRDKTWRQMKEQYIPLQIPPFDDINVSEEDMIKCRNLFEQVATLIRDRCGIFEIHIAYYTILKLKDNILESMRLNLELVNEEFERRKNELEKQ